jgi:dienelactone hydrolase
MLARRLPFISALLLIAAFLASAKETPAPRTVDLTALDGTILKATFFAAASAGPGVLLFHQCNQDRKAWDGLATQLAASGINVLTVDYRGFGESGGPRYATLNNDDRTRAVYLEWPGDMDTAFQFLVSQKGVKPGIAGAGGASCGVNEAVQLARRHPEIKSIALLSGGTNPGGRQFLDTAKSLPIFMSVADDDQQGTLTVFMEWMLGLSANPSDKFQHYATGGHGTAMFQAHPELPGMIVDWFVTTLVKTPGKAPAVGLSGMPVAEAHMIELIDEPGNAGKIALQITDERAHDPKAAPLSEFIVNRIGYEHLIRGDAKGAIEIFKVNVVAFPNSPNTYDSLGDGYFADGQKDLARQYAEKALAMLATDTTDSPQQRDNIKTNAELKLKP